MGTTQAENGSKNGNWLGAASDGIGRRPDCGDLPIPLSALHRRGSTGQEDTPGQFTRFLAGLSSRGPEASPFFRFRRFQFEELSQYTAGNTHSPANAAERIISLKNGVRHNPRVL